jgi:hypothetical protein
MSLVPNERAYFKEPNDANIICLGSKLSLQEVVNGSEVVRTRRAICAVFLQITVWWRRGRWRAPVQVHVNSYELPLICLTISLISNISRVPFLRLDRFTGQSTALSSCHSLCLFLFLFYDIRFWQSQQVRTLPWKFRI